MMKTNMEVIKNYSGLGVMMVVYNDLLAMEDLLEVSLISDLEDEEVYSLLDRIVDNLGEVTVDYEYDIRDIINEMDIFDVKL